MNTSEESSHSIANRDFSQIKEKVLSWVQQFGTFCLLDNHQYQFGPHSEECLVAAGVRRSFRANAGQALSGLQSFIDEKKTWLFGHLGFGLQSETEQVNDRVPDPIGFADCYFFEPEYLIRLRPGLIEIKGKEPGKTWQQIEQTLPRPQKTELKTAIRQRFSREQYLELIRKLKEHILRGDCYEINFCQEFYMKEAVIDPLKVYHHLSDLSPNPFSALYRNDHQWLLCASPERFLRKEGERILSQPIKGTARRVRTHPEIDEAIRQELEQSRKDRSENVMVVDLVRNDLSKICLEGTVAVDELFGIYSFPQVHQMISTVSGTLKTGLSFTEMIRATFPMGSMTGAPKKRVLELISQYEKSNRGVFSGALGYINPAGDFDFNVVIRSILYNETSGYVSWLAGSGITWYSDPEKEWEECILKASAIEQVLR